MFIYSEHKNILNNKEAGDRILSVLKEFKRGILDRL